MGYTDGETLSNTDSLKTLVAAEDCEYKYDNSLRKSAFSTISCGIKY